jgi:carbamoyl-phosphate synthase large subunit
MKYTVAISGINAMDNPGPGTGIARSLKESGLDIRTVGLAYDSMEPGIYMDWVIDKSYILPYPSGDVDSFMSRLLDIHKRENFNVIITALDAELPVYIKIEHELAKHGIGIMVPTRQSFRDRNKDNLMKLAPEIGLKHPKTICLSNASEIDHAIAELKLPMMIKGPFYGASKVNSKEEGVKQFHELASKWGYPILAQEVIDGEEYNLIGLGDGSGNDIGHVAIKKMVITKQGKVWTNVSIRNELLFTACKNFIKKSQWCGGFELELMLDHKTNELFLIEINPRFPAWVYMATGCGINLPERMVSHILKLPYETHSEYKAGKIMVRYTDEIISDMNLFEKLTTVGES